jgi:undecaprenyl-diphosphatase
MLMSLENLNFAWFALINATPDASPRTISFAIFLATMVVYGVAIWMLLAWIRKPEAFRFALLDTVFTITLTLSLSWVIGQMWYHPRPFEIGLGQNFLAHAADSSFPSDHATLLFSVALPLLAYTISRNWGIIIFVCTLAVAWARVYLGIHFPFDIVGALIVAAISTSIIKFAGPVLKPYIYAPVCDFYEWLIATLHLPVVLFPREKE